MWKSVFKYTSGLVTVEVTKNWSKGKANYSTRFGSPKGESTVPFIPLGDSEDGLMQLNSDMSEVLRAVASFKKSDAETDRALEAERVAALAGKKEKNPGAGKGLSRFSKKAT